MAWYIALVKTHPVIMAMVQFALLGTLGDAISKWIVQKRVFVPFSPARTTLKMLQWAFIGICIKYAFTGFHGFVDVLVDKSFLPKLNLFTNALALSIFTNLQFGPFLVILHRWSDNLVCRSNNWDNLDKGMKSLVWFWMPAHTVTFMLPEAFQIGLAALWSIALGIILGIYRRSN